MRLTRHAVLPLLALGFVGALAAALALSTSLTDVPPDEPRGMAQWLVRHPADWHTSARLTERSLDIASPDRIRVWKVLYKHAKTLAPHRVNADAAFVRAGLFHWYELPAADRKAVLASPLFRDPAVFAELYSPLWQLTRDLETLRRLSPRTVSATTLLMKTAAENGHFDAYRELRSEAREQRLREAMLFVRQGKVAELMNLVPAKLSTADLPLVKMVLSSFARHTQGATMPLPVIEFALRQDLPEAAALSPIVEDPTYPPLLRARLALELQLPEKATRIETSSADPHAPEWIAYFLERADFEASQGRASDAQAYLNRATSGGLTPSLLRVAVRTARLGGNVQEERQYLAQLRTARDEPRHWTGTCAAGELCSHAELKVVDAGGTLPLLLATTQRDEVPPYVEVYVDDRLVQEGAVDDELRVAVPLGEAGNHRVELRLINPMTRSGVQRRVRMS